MYLILSLECINKFVKVEYDPSTKTISCIFQNELDLSPKSCNVKYKMCGQEIYMYSAQNSTTYGSLSTLTIKLNKIAMDSQICYLVTANNDTLTVMVKGRFETQSPSSDLGVIIGSVIGAILLVSGLVIMIVVIVIVIAAYFYFLKRGKRKRGMLNLAVTVS